MSREIDFSFVDMHCHILPGVDDGSKDTAMSLNMLRIAYENNIRTIIVTPHNKIYQKSASNDGIYRRISKLQEEIYRQDMDIKLYPGSELYFDSSLITRLEEGQVMTMGETKFILVEFSPSDDYAYIREALKKLRYEGYRPILAHVERYECLYKDKKRIDELVYDGIFLQVNADSIMMGAFSHQGGFVRRLLKEKKISFVGTDAHRDSGARTPKLLDCAHFLIKKYGYDYAREILCENAKCLINDELIEKKIEGYEEFIAFN